MMISPEGYYSEYLDGKTKEQILTTIRGLKQEIGKLKKIIENPSYGNERIIHPSEAIRLECTRTYLARAKEAYKEVGGVYTPSQAELKSEKFDSNISSISKIVLEIGSFDTGSEVHTVKIDEKHIYFDVESLYYLRPTNLPGGQDCPCSKDEFLDEIKSLHLGEWKNQYVDYSVLDGIQWSLTVEFSNGLKPLHISGSNAYPYNFSELKELSFYDDDNE